MIRSQRRFVSIALAVLFLALTLGSPVFAVKPINSTRFGNLAIDGYDPVAYFEQAKAVEGDKRFSHEWNGAVWRFVSEEHKTLFAGAPEKYAPQYGGYCAYAVAKGSTANGDPELWTVHEDKLYLNYSKSVQKKWVVDIPGHIAKADKNWPEILAD